MKRQRGFDPHSGGVKLSQFRKIEVENRIQRFADQHLKNKYDKIEVRFRGPLCYIAALQAESSGEEIEKLHRDKKILLQEQEKIDAGLKRVIKKIADDLITDSEANDVVQDFRKRKEDLNTRLVAINTTLLNMPSAEILERKAKLIERTIMSAYHNPPQLNRMINDDKRELVQTVFSGKGPDGERLGAYVFKPEGKNASPTFELKGVFSDFDEHLNFIKQKMRRQCHAHHSFGVYQ